MRRAVNEIYLYLLWKQQHAEACTDKRCVANCEVVKFQQWLMAPLLRGDVDAQGRLEALARGDIPA